MGGEEKDGVNEVQTQWATVATRVTPEASLLFIQRREKKKRFFR